MRGDETIENYRFVGGTCVLKSVSISDNRARSHVQEAVLPFLVSSFPLIWKAGLVRALVSRRETLHYSPLNFSQNFGSIIDVNLVSSGRIRTFQFDGSSKTA